MVKNPRVEVKIFELVELASRAFKRYLIAMNIKAGTSRLDLNGQESSHWIIMLLSMILAVAMPLMWMARKTWITKSM